MRIMLMTACLCLLACPRAQAAPSAAALKHRLTGMVRSAPGLQDARVAMYIKVLKSGRVLYDYHGDTPMTPASNLKLLTTSTVLSMLGPDFRYNTEVLGPPPDSSGTVHGDLVLRGSGDPSFCYPYDDPSTEPLRYFVRQLRKQGVRHVTGGVIADDAAFDRHFLGRGWHDRYLLDPYAAPVSALSLNSNVVGLTITPGGVETQPSSPTLKIDDQVKVGDYNRVWVQRKPGASTIHVDGVITPGTVLRRQVTVTNPARFTAGAFLELLSKGGVQVDGSIKMLPAGDRPSIDNLKVYARYQSPTLEELITRTNHVSDNLFADQMFKTAGEHYDGYGTFKSGFAAVLSFLHRHHVGTTGLKMVDGNGLSDLDRVTPHQLVGCLQAMWRSSYGQDFINTLPAPGEGTLRYRLAGLVVRAKTGTLKSTSSLSGYVVSGYGQTIAFSVLVNRVAPWNAMQFQNHVVKLLADWPEPL